MIEPLVNKQLREAAKHRQLEIKQCLALHGLTRGPRRLSYNERASIEDSHFRRLRRALVSLGPVFASFGLYLSSRADLFSAKDCLELAAIPDRAEPTPPPAIWEEIRGEIGCSPADAYSTFDEQPFESRLMYQSHRASLNSGQAVIVKIIHPELIEYLTNDFKMLPLLQDAIALDSWAEDSIDRAIIDFSREFRKQLDFVYEAEMTEALAKDLKGEGRLTVPMVHAELCTSKLLTIERLSGINLVELVSPINTQMPGEGSASDRVNKAAKSNFHDLASLLYRLWLQQCLQGRLFAVNPRCENITLLARKQIAFAGGNFARIPSDATASLFDYLIAASTQDPDKACRCLIREMEQGTNGVSEDELQHKLRQIVPFRDGAWSSKGGCNSLAEFLFVQWKRASECGYRPRAHLLSFYRGLCLIASVAHQLAPDRDLLLEAVQDLRLNAVFAQFREVIDVGQFNDRFEEFAATMMSFPQTFDVALTHAAEGDSRPGRRNPEPARHHPKNSAAAIVVWLFLLASIALVSQRLSESDVNRMWAERISAIAFVLVGVLLLRAASGSR